MRLIRNDKIFKTIVWMQSYLEILGDPLCATFIPAWPFRCEKCEKMGWSDQGYFPNKESYLFYRESLGDDFKWYWTYFIETSLVGDYFAGKLFMVTRDNKE